MNKLILFLTVLLLVLSATSPSIASNHADTYGFSATGISLGNAMTARVNDWSSVYYNMAGLGKSSARKEGHTENAQLNQIAVNYLHSEPQFDIDIPLRWKEVSNERIDLRTEGDKELDTSTVIFGLTVDLNGRVYDMPEFISTARFGLGLGIPSDLSAAKVNDLDPRTHNFIRYGRETEKLLLLSGVGFGFLDDAIGVGIGTNSSFSGEGTVVMENVEFEVDRVQTPNSQAKMDLKIEPSMVFGLYFSPGIIFPALQGLDFGFSYREDNQMEIDPYDAAAITDVGSITLHLVMAIFDYYQPVIMTAGVSYQFGEKLIVSADVEVQKWSDYEVSRTVKINHGADLPDLDDILIYKVGVEYILSNRLSLLGGYYYEPTFIPSDASTGVVNFLDNDKHVGSIGIKYLMNRMGGFKAPIEFIAGYQFQHLEDQDVTKNSPTSLNPNYSYGGTCHSLVVGFTY